MRVHFNNNSTTIYGIAKNAKKQLISNGNLY